MYSVDITQCSHRSADHIAVQYYILQIIAFIGLLAVLVRAGYHIAPQHSAAFQRASAVATPYFSGADASSDNLEINKVYYPPYPLYPAHLPYWLY